MNRFTLFLILAIFISSCGINKQAQQIKALEKCNYKFLSADNITIAGTDVKKLVNGSTINLSNAPALAFAYLRKDIPLKATVNLEISNPSNTLAAINNFEYIILVNQQQIAAGLVDQRISIDAGQTTNVPMQLNTNIYQLLTDGKTLQDVTDFLSAANSGKEKKGLVTLKIKPSIMVGNGLVKYPGYITIDKEVSSKILL